MVLILEWQAGLTAISPPQYLRLVNRRSPDRFNCADKNRWGYFSARPKCRAALLLTVDDQIIGAGTDADIDEFMRDMRLEVNRIPLIQLMDHRFTWKRRATS
jgi:hypothetical protein